MKGALLNPTGTAKSQRKRKASTRVRDVDASTVQAAHERRLAALEDDDAGVHAPGIENDDDDGEYLPGANSSDEEMTGTRGAPTRKRSRRRTRATRRDPPTARGIERFNMSLSRMLLEEQRLQRPKDMPAFDDIAARPGSIPRRPFCAVCGFRAPYTCVRCAARFCTVRCGNVHEQTQCLKFTS